MKHGKKPTVAQRKFMDAHGIIWQNWLVVKDTQEQMVLVHRHFDDRTKVIQKE